MFEKLSITSLDLEAYLGLAPLKAEKEEKNKVQKPEEGASDRQEPRELEINKEKEALEVIF
jgi:hypothetical protein